MDGTPGATTANSTSSRPVATGPGSPNARTIGPAGRRRPPATHPRESEWVAWAVEGPDTTSVSTHAMSNATAAHCATETRPRRSAALDRHAPRPGDARGPEQHPVGRAGSTVLAARRVGAAVAVRQRAQPPSQAGAKPPRGMRSTGIAHRARAPGRAARGPRPLVAGSARSVIRRTHSSSCASSTDRPWTRRPCRRAARR